MTEVYRFFDVAQYTEADQAEVQTRFRKDGLIYEAANRLAISAPGGMFIRVATGEMMIQGFWYKNDSNLDLAIAANSSGFTRIDRIVLHLDRNGNSAHIIVLTGTPSGSPSAPNVTQNPGGSWEISLGTISIPTGTLAITGGMLTTAIPVSQAFTNSAELPSAQILGSHIASGTIATDNMVQGSVRKLQYSFVGNTDILTGSGLAASSTTSLTGTLLFPVDATSSIIEVYVSGHAYLIPTTGGETGMHVLIDNVSTYRLGGAAGGTVGLNPFAGGTSVQFTGLSGPANHQINIQLYTNAAMTNAYLRCSSQPLIEHFSFYIMENKKA